jgi:hypothetical protein
MIIKVRVKQVEATSMVEDVKATYIVKKVKMEVEEDYVRFVSNMTT